MNGLSLTEFSFQLRQYSTSKLNWDLPVVIRGMDGDYGVAAVHIDNEQVVIDLGVEL